MPSTTPDPRPGQSTQGEAPDGSQTGQGVEASDHHAAQPEAAPSEAPAKAESDRLPETAETSGKGAAIMRVIEKWRAKGLRPRTPARSHEQRRKRPRKRPSPDHEKGQ